MVEGNEPAALSLRLHRVLLALAGRLDDTALSQARRLAARARTGEAAELVGGALIAGDIPVRSAEQAELAAVLTASGAEEWFATNLRVDDATDAGEHRFSGTETASDGVAEALDLVVHRLPDVRSVHAVWRNTVAGTTPGPMPQRVVLAEVGPEGSALATAYRMDTALRRAGIRAAVEVLETGADWPAYHRLALRSAVRVTGGSSTAEDPAAVTSSYEKSDTPSYERPSYEPAGESAYGAEREAVDHRSSRESFESASRESATEAASYESATESARESAAEPASYEAATEPSYESSVPAEPEPEARTETAEWPAPPEPEQPSEEPAAQTPEPPAQPTEETSWPQSSASSSEQSESTGQYVDRPWTTQMPQIDVVESTGDSDLEPGELFWPQAEASAKKSASQTATAEPSSGSTDETVPPETPAEQTTEMSAAEQEALRAAIAADKPAEQAPDSEQTTITPDGVNAPTRVNEPAVAFPPKDLDNPRLSERDRELLRELHAELAKREQSAQQVRLNGWEPGVGR